MFKKIVGYFFSGIALVLPVVLTIYAIYYIISSLGATFTVKTALLWGGIILVSLIIIGYLASSFLGNIFWSRFEKLIYKTPILGLIYKALKDLTTAFVGTDKKFTEPVIVKFSSEPIYKLGFVTNKNAAMLTAHMNLEKENETLYLVYFPLSLSVSGDLFLVPDHKIKAIDMKAQDVMQIIVSGGIINMEN